MSATATSSPAGPGRPEAPGGPLGVFGGTFDPVHFGHLRLAEEAAERLGLQGVRWIPAGRPALRAAPRVGPAERLTMVRLAIAGNPRFTLDAAEIEAAAPSYTVPTLERLRRAENCGTARPLVLLLGSDAFAALPEWHCWERLFDLAHIGVAQRPGATFDPERLPPALAAALRRRACEDPARLADSPAGRIAAFETTPLDISATRIRALLAAGKSPRYLLPEAVAEHIRQHRYYTED
ncbi:MAG: nicotinate-nucleotide adenylyltransferase [Candidatus Accumulibacter sp.]|jgi:nicotinate-nucleotide adenylyltransferase|nr:nicotinate-nucleotide adenylyltransferase [Accumulibacter sp.]